MEFKNSNQCIKLNLPLEGTADVLTPVLQEMKKWIQDTADKPESGGYIVGYTHENSRNISLEQISHPFLFDERNRVRFKMKDPRHTLFLIKMARRQSYYMGVWHTHPQADPAPSSIDWNDWRKTLGVDSPAGRYMFFVIVGTERIRFWVGDTLDGSISEIYECPKDDSGLYKTLENTTGGADYA